MVQSCHPVQCEQIPERECKKTNIGEMSVRLSGKRKNQVTTKVGTDGEQ